ncbi:MAG: cytochrome P450, partial [Tepidisphaeraceae bacterium]
GYGRSRGLPPGSLALAPLDPWRDHLFYLKQAARHGPIFKVSNFVQPMVCVVGLKQAMELLHTSDRSLGIQSLPFTRFIPRGFLRYMEPADHKVYSAVFRAGIARTVVRECEPFITGTIRSELSRLAEASSQPRACGVHPEPYLTRMIFIIWVRLFFGIAPDTQQFTRLRELYRVLDTYNATFFARRVEEALQEATAILQEQIAQWSPAVAQDDEAAADCFLKEIVRARPESAEDQTVIRNLIYILQASWRDVAGLHHWILKLLSDHPVWAARIRAEAALEDRSPGRDSPGRELPGRESPGQGSHDLATRTVLETLRLEQSEYLMRQTLQDVKVGEFVIPRGWLLRVCVRESHRSADVFTDPDLFNPDRFLAHTYARAEYSPFGASRLMCPGDHLTITIGSLFAREIARGFDCQVMADGPRELGGFHWKPSSRLRLRLIPVGPQVAAAHAGEDDLR